MKPASRKRSEATPNETGPATVLHVDDDPNDAELLKTATAKAGVSVLIQNVEDADQAVAYLTGAGVYADRRQYPFPSLVLLDLKLPRVNGVDLLKWIRTQPALERTPVVVLSGSELRDHMKEAYAVGASSYIVKPVAFGGLVAMVQGLSKDWLRLRST
jgi:CheY-like chemotaxis protein